MNNRQNDKRRGKYPFLLCGVFAAVTAICSWIMIPLPFTPVPINLGLLAVYLAGGLLGPRYGTISQLVYVLLGAIGLPVFAGFGSGISALAGPTGGFILGYILCAFVVGLLIQCPTHASFDPPAPSGGLRRDGPASSDTPAPSRSFSRLRSALAMTLGLATCYAFGLGWFMFLTKASFWAGFAACVLPFLPGDIVKIALATTLLKRLRAIKIE